MPQHGCEQFDPFFLRVHQHGRAAQHQVQRHPEVLDRHLAVALAQHAERIALARPGLRHAIGVAVLRRTVSHDRQFQRGGKADLEGGAESGS